MKNLSTSLDTIGLLTSTVAYAEQVYRVLAPGNVEPSSDTPRLAFSRQPNWELADSDARTAIEACVGKLRGAGFAIDELESSRGFEDMTRVGNVIHDYEMYRALGPEFTTARDRMAPALAARIEQAAHWTVADHRDALKAAERERIAFGKLMENYDAVLCLGASGEAPAGLSNTGSPMMSSAWTTLHAPCLTLPLMTGANDLPIGLQLVADRYQDLKLLSIGAVLEIACA